MPVPSRGRRVLACRSSWTVPGLSDNVSPHQEPGSTRAPGLGRWSTSPFKPTAKDRQLVPELHFRAVLTAVNIRSDLTPRVTVLASCPHPPQPDVHESQNLVCQHPALEIRGCAHAPLGSDDFQFG